MSALIIKTVEEKIEEIGDTINYLHGEIEGYRKRLKESEADHYELSVELEKLKAGE
jgi:regulator of replication initiation timing